MSVISGQRTVGNISSDQRAIDMAKPILLLEPSAAPLTVLLGNIEGRKRRAIDPTFKWLEDRAEARFDAVNYASGYNSSATSVVVDTGEVFAAQDIIKAPSTGEILYVSSVSSNTLTVVRGFAGSTAASLADDTVLLIIGTAAKEGDTSLAARSENPTTKTNYTQIFKTSVDASGTALSSSNESSPHDWDHQRKKGGIEHVKDIEYAFWHSKPYANTVGSSAVRTTGGVFHFCTSNNQDMGGTMTESEFEQFIRNGFRYGTQSKKTLFVSPLAMSVINQFSVSKLQTTVGQTKYGVQIREVATGHGMVNLVKANMMEGATYGGYMALLDLADETFAYRYLDGDGPGGSRDTKLLEHREENDRDGRKDEWLSEVGLQCGQAERHAVATGITG